MRRLDEENLLDPISFPQEDSLLRAMASSDDPCIPAAQDKLL